MTTSDITPACCDNPGTFDVIRKKVTMADGSVKVYTHKRKICGKCIYRRARVKTYERKNKSKETMNEVTITTTITSCKECPHFKEGPMESTDGFDSGNDWICRKANKVIAGFVEWHEVSKTKIPDWCPIKK